MIKNGMIEAYWSTGGLSSSCEMIILRNKSHGVCMNIYDRSKGLKKCSQIPNKNTLPYFHSASLVIWTLPMLKRSHLSELSNSRFTNHMGSPRLHTLFVNARSEKRNIQAQNDQAATNPTQNLSAYIAVSFQFITNSILPVKLTLSRSLLPKFPV